MGPSMRGSLLASERGQGRPCFNWVPSMAATFFAAERSEWDPNTLVEGRYDVARTIRRFEEANAILVRA
jgi:hypothetical protein